MKNDYLWRATLMLSILLETSVLSFSQTDWTTEEKANYKTIKELCTYYQTRAYDTTQRNFLFDQFIYFENILQDDSLARVQSRLRKFDGLFGRLLHFVDSVGLEHLDAKPTRFFSSDSEYYIPFEQDGDLYEAVPHCLTYFDRRRPKEPIGTLIFEENTHRMFAWIVINQGGGHYFLTFSLL